MDIQHELYVYLLLLFPIILFFRTKKQSSKRFPPGSCGLPIIGQSLSLLNAMRANKGEEWLQTRVEKYGPISKFNFFGTTTVFLHGQAANKFIYTCDERVLSSQQPAPMPRLVGERNILELSGEDHKRVRAAFISFLKPEALRQLVGKMDEEIRLHLDKNWHGKQEIMVMSLTKALTFDVICSLIFGIERGSRRDTLVKLFETLMEGMLSLPINLPFTRFNRGLEARSKIKAIIMELIREKRENLEKAQSVSTYQDLITSMICMKDGDTNEPLVSDEEIVDNAVLLMIGAQDTTSVLLTFLIKVLADHPSVYNNVLNEQEKIAKYKALGEPLTWDDLARMKYTWRVATESLRMYPPFFFSFRKVLQDLEYGGYVIPKGWQVAWSPFVTHMDASIFSNPSEFNPSRFEKQGTNPPYSFIAFGGGPRMCPGHEFARVETLTLVHYLVNGFTWKLSLKENAFGRDPKPVFEKGLPIQIQVKNSRDEV